MNTKWIIALILALLGLFGVTGCQGLGGKRDPNETPEQYDQRIKTNLQAMSDSGAEVDFDGHISPNGQAALTQGIQITNESYFNFHGRLDPMKAALAKKATSQP